MSKILNKEKKRLGEKNSFHISQLATNRDHFVWRTPEATDWDFEIGDLTDDTNWNDLDLSAILPSGATSALITIVVQDNAVGSRVQFRKNGQVGGFQLATIRTQVVNAVTDGMPFQMGVDSNRKAEIKCTPKPTDWTNILIVILGWTI